MENYNIQEKNILMILKLKNNVCFWHQSDTVNMPGSVDNCLKNLRPVACPRDPWIPRIDRGTWAFGGLDIEVSSIDS